MQFDLEQPNQRDNMERASLGSTTPHPKFGAPQYSNFLRLRCPQGMTNGNQIFCDDQTR